MLHSEYYYQHVKRVQDEERQRVRLEHLAYSDRPYRPGVGARGRLIAARLLIGLGRWLEGRGQRVST